MTKLSIAVKTVFVSKSLTRLSQNDAGTAIFSMPNNVPGTDLNIFRNDQYHLTRLLQTNPGFTRFSTNGTD